MRRFLRTEIVMTIAILYILVIFELTYHTSSDLVGSHHHTITHSKPSGCKIWPNIPTLDPIAPEFIDRLGTVESPHVGDLGVLGNPQKCLTAVTRFGGYHESAGHNWSEVKWGMYTRQVANYIACTHIFLIQGEVQSRCASISRYLQPEETSIQ